MSKLGLHVSSGNRRGFGDYLQKCATAGSPVPVIFSVGQDVWQDVQRYSPTTKLIFRTQNDVRQNEIGDGPGSMYTGDPVQTAHDWMSLMMPVWALNKADYYAPLNEQDPALLSGFTWLNAFSIECMKIGEANGYKLDIYPFYGSDVGPVWRSGADVIAGLIGPGVDASHHYERTHIDSLVATIRLIIEYLLA